jgi:tripartite-type tricarboxylate transporter receptor subunit TctC
VKLPAHIVIISLFAINCAVAANYPDKTLRLLMPYPAGGSIDFAGRVVARELADNLGQAVVVDNRTGAGGMVGTELGAHAAPARSR